MNIPKFREANAVEVAAALVRNPLVRTRRSCPACLLSFKSAETSTERLVKASLWYEAKMLEFCPRPIGNVEKGLLFLQEGHV
jgi:hypothetical protein